MIESIIRLFDRLIQWRTYRDKRRRDAFSDLFEPLYTELEKIHRNYGAIFRDARKRLSPEQIVQDFESDASRMKETVALLKMRRAELEYLRVKVIAFAGKLAQIDWGKEEAAFVRTVLEYFTSGLEPVPRIVGHTKLSQIMHALYEKGIKEENILAGVDLIENAVFYQIDQWAAVCETFAELKTAVYAKT